MNSDKLFEQLAENPKYSCEFKINLYLVWFFCYLNFELLLPSKRLKFVNVKILTYVKKISGEYYLYTNPISLWIRLFNYKKRCALDGETKEDIIIGDYLRLKKGRPLKYMIYAYVVRCVYWKYFRGLVFVKSTPEEIDKLRK
ncbi:MAG: hypothetical protein A2Z57_04395 [Planctomycetes bacterium RIFCSPHIGHO2_12_39_6]|nr:MAG: hypothetical protein A2Z57_04395 [Planctomycetes bacterium RIFCSPHIGHO2_12_39_6]